MLLNRADGNANWKINCMKKILLFLVTLTTLNGMAQTSVYYPFPEDSASWCASICSNQGNSFNDATYQLNGKIFINGNWYSRMYYHGRYCFGAAACICGAINASDTTTYFIRQDATQRKVWIYIPSTNSDTIFLDFNLNIGDTIDARKAFWAGQFSFVGIVSAIDSVLIGTQYRTRYQYDDQGFPNYLIEGIGPTHGFFNPPNHGYDLWPVLNIFSQSNQIFYPFYSNDTIGMGQSCYDFTTRLEVPNQIVYKISPNPCQSFLTITFGKLVKQARIEITTMLGEIVSNVEVCNEFQRRFDLKNISSGFYLVKVFDKEKYYCKKLIVERD